MRIHLDVPLTTEEIANATNGKSNTNKLISYITTDSREVHRDDLFIALIGEKYNGETFINDVIDKGAIPLSTLKIDSGITVLESGKALLNLAKYYKNKLGKLIKTVAITGSVGKTTTKEFLQVILSSYYKVHATPANLNNRIGMPMTVLSAKADTEILILEMGMNHAGEIKEMSDHASPDIAIITKIGTSHIGNLGSRINIAKAKLEVTHGMKNGTLIVPHSEKLIPDQETNISFSISNKNANYFINTLDEETSIIYEYGQELGRITSKPGGSSSNECLSAAVACSRLIGLSKCDLIKGISHISNENIRQSLITRGNLTFLCDFYNASLESVLSDIEIMEQIQGYAAKSLVLGEIYELGEFSETIHKKIGKNITPTFFSHLFLIGQKTKAIMEGALSVGFPIDRILFNPNINDPLTTANQIVGNSLNNEILLLKGSRKVKMERILELINDH